MLRSTPYWALLAILMTGCQASVSAGGHAAAATGTTDEAPDGEPGVRVTQGLPAVAGNNQDVAIGAGRYEGDLLVGGNHNNVHGAGAGATIVTGRLQVSGNHNTVTGLTVLGRTELAGNENDVTGAELKGAVNASGNDNKH